MEIESLYGQRIAEPASGIELEKDKLGFTNKNLHRRIEVHPLANGETQPREYTLGIYTLESYRTTTKYYHDEDSDDSEIP